jgi:hypothetical protein
MLMPRRWRRPLRTSPLLSSRALVRGSVSSQAEAGRQAQLSKRARALFPSCVPASKDSSKASARACAACWENVHCAAAMVTRLSGLTSWNSGSHRSPALLCRDTHWGQSCSPVGTSNGRKASGPWRMAWWVMAVAARYAALPSAGQERDRPRPPCRSGRVICVVSGPSTLGRPKMAKTPSTALLWARCTAAATCAAIYIIMQAPSPSLDASTPSRLAVEAQ